MASVQIVWTFNLYQYMLPGGVCCIMGLPITKVCQYSHIMADATPVMNKSFEKLLSNNFQVIIFERMAKNYFKVNT